MATFPHWQGNSRHYSSISDSVDPLSSPIIPRILSLDGGGVRGLSSLLILREIMDGIEQHVGASEVIKPCDYFDLIGGTSTGGLIAIMLGSLRMVRLSSNVLSPDCE
jgi:patatin-like phospholipase/acyl hydrolase